jgi:hypothetical protein
MAEDAQPAEPSACFVRLTSGLAVAAQLAAISGPGDCGAPDVVRLDAVMSSDQRRIAIEPPPTLRCEMAEAVAAFIRDDIATATAAFGSALQGVENYDSFDCRGRNRVAGTKTSEHGRANALDVRAFRLADGRRLELTDAAVDRSFREQVRSQACARFKTVLGPGSDGYHENHVHVDLAERRNGYRICQWDVRLPEPVVPLPPERPLTPPREL